MAVTVESYDNGKSGYSAVRYKLHARFYEGLPYVYKCCHAICSKKRYDLRRRSAIFLDLLPPPQNTHHHSCSLQHHHHNHHHHQYAV